MQIRHWLDSHNPISMINYGREKNIPTQILTDKYGFGVSFGEQHPLTIVVIMTLKGSYMRSGHF